MVPRPRIPAIVLPRFAASGRGAVLPPRLLGILRPALPAQRRYAWWNPFRRPGRADKDQPGQELDQVDARQAMEAMQSERGRTIFDDTADAPQEAEEGGVAERKPAAKSGPDGGSMAHVPDARLVVDPDPRSGARWQRKKVVQTVRRTGVRAVATRAERLARSERELVVRSEWLPTSYKKLGMLARQVAGRSVEDALAQMRFSAKASAVDVAAQLRAARDQAAIQAGMGLGGGKLGAALRIRTATGKAVHVTDSTQLYIEQAWVNKGSFRPSAIDYKARGRYGQIRPPTCSISVRLKEEKTRIREHREREAKRARKRPWVHLPDRPINGQRPFYSW